MNRELFVRSKYNPILTSENWPYSVAAVFNPAAIKHNGETHLIVRIGDRKGHSHLSVARSKNGLTDWTVSPKPALEADPRFFEGKRGLEDPRIVWVEELQQFIIACVSFRMEYPEEPHGISLLGTKDFLIFDRVSKPLGLNNKNACLFPERFDGRFALIHRPIVRDHAHVAVSFSLDLIHWGGGRSIFTTRTDSWDESKVGLGCPPIKTEEGWLLIYHGSFGKAEGLIYRFGLALLDLKTLELKKRSEEWVFGPEKDYEGGPNGIVFPCGCVVDPETGKVTVYYGCDDLNIGVATSTLEDILDYLR